MSGDCSSGPDWRAFQVTLDRGKPQRIWKSLAIENKNTGIWDLFALKPFLLNIIGQADNCVSGAYV